MKKIILFISVFSLYYVSFSINPESKDSIPEINQLNSGIVFSDIEKADKINEIPANPQKEIENSSPGGIPSFWWSFVLSAIGSYTLYGIGAGPVSVLIVFFASGRNKKEIRKSIWGWISGTVVGIGLWVLVRLR